jgi:hypothetical protein
MLSRNSEFGYSRNPLSDPLSRRFLRRLAWVGVLAVAAYTALVLTWIVLDPRW